MKRGYVDTEFGQVHYYADGTGGPFVFLFHETALSGNEFEKTLPYLARHGRAIAFDTPGYGLSDPPPAPLTMAEIAERLSAAIDGFGDGPCALAGAHTGASIALELAAHRLSERTTHVVYTGLPLFTAEQITSIRTRTVEAEIRQDCSHLMAQWQELVERWGEARNDDLDMLYWGMVERLLTRERAHWGHEAVFSHDTGTALSKISCPAYFLVGQYDRLVESDRQAAASVAGSTLKVLPGVGGRLPCVEPELYARELLEFIGVAG